jgi:flagellar basal-body rod protein FlgB
MPTSVKLLQNLLDYCTEKNRVIAKNISNIGSENYKRQDVVFKEILTESSDSLLRKTSSRHIDEIKSSQTTVSKFEYIQDQSEEMVSGVNNVNIEREMSELAENTLRFRFASKRVGDYYKTIQNVIKSGGKA